MFQLVKNAIQEGGLDRRFILTTDLTFASNVVIISMNRERLFSDIGIPY